MCEVNGEYAGLPERRVAPSESKKCVKCKETTAALVIKAGETLCRSCFKEYFVHKFRAVLGKNRILFPGEKVLLAVSGGASSCAMLNQVQEGLSQKAHKKLRFKPGIVYIDEGGVLGQSLEERRRTMAEMQSLFESTGFPYHILPLEQVLDLPSSVLEPVHSSSDKQAESYKAVVDGFNRTNLHPEKRADGSGFDGQIDNATPAPLSIDEGHTRTLQKLFCSLKTLTAKEDLLHTLRQHLLIHTARTEGYSKLMLGENCTRLAVKLLASVSMGRGAQLAVDTGFSDPRFGNIVTVRPMRDYTVKEISYYNYMWKIPCVFIPSLDTKTKDKASIQRLTESFVVKLQGDFPSTVSTIYRTSEKLQTASLNQGTSKDSFSKCLLCMCAFDTLVGETTAFQAILISERLSQRGVVKVTNTGGTAVMQDRRRSADTEQCCVSGPKQEGEEGCEAQGRGGCCSHVMANKSLEMESLLCYSCRLTVKDMSSLEVLPQYILSEAQRRKNRSHMRVEISEFLLDEEFNGCGEES